MAEKTFVNLTQDFVSTQSNTTGEFSEIVEVQTPVGREFRYDPSRPVEFFMQAHEQKTASGATPETFSLANKVADSPLLDGDSGTNGTDSSPPGNGSADVVVYVNGSQVTPDEVRYHDAAANANEVDVDTSATDTVDIYYLFADSFEITGEAYIANEQAFQPVFTGTRGLHLANIYNENEMYTFDNSFKVGPKEKLKFKIHADVDLTNWNSNTDDQAAPTSGAESFSKMRLPVMIEEVSGRKSRSRGRGFGVSAQGGRMRGSRR